MPALTGQRNIQISGLIQSGVYGETIFSWRSGQWAVIYSQLKPPLIQISSSWQSCLHLSMCPASHVNSRKSESKLEINNSTNCSLQVSEASKSTARLSANKIKRIPFPLTFHMVSKFHAGWLCLIEIHWPKKRSTILSPVWVDINIRPAYDMNDTN